MRDVFISHAEEDAAVSIDIATRLEGAGFTTWYYERDCTVGISHPRQTRQAIDQSKAVILIISKGSIASHWVNDEVLYSSHIKKSIVPVFINISRADLEIDPPDWYSPIATVVSISISKEGIPSIIPSMIKGLNSLGVFPMRGDSKNLRIDHSGNISTSSAMMGESKCIRRLVSITPPEPNFVDRSNVLRTITEWYKDPGIRIGALTGLGGDGKSSIVRKWYDSLSQNGIKPDGIFWWGFYRNAYLDRFLDSLLEFLARETVHLIEIKSTWAKVDKINALIQKGEYLIIMDGFEEVQKGKECDDEFGCMQYQELTEILRFIADSQSRGLCLITSRYPLTDLEKWEGATYRKQNVERLDIEDGRLLFEKIGIVGDQKDIDHVIEKHNGHALSLTLLAKYLVEDFKGNIRGAEEIPSLTDDGVGGRARAILVWYRQQLSVEQLSFMEIFSLFRRAVDKRDFEGVFRLSMQTPINKPLMEMNLFSFNRMVNNLCNRCLIFKGQDSIYATHPLIKGYFESITSDEDNKACHKKIYEHIGTYAPSNPKTLKEMHPLLEQVYHGCKAGLYDEAFNVYWNHIQRRNEFYLVYSLGAWETNLSLVLNFFQEGDLSRITKLKKKSDQTYLLNSAGLSLFAIGRPSDAAGLFKYAIELYIEDRDWENASVVYENLTALQFRLGNLKEAQDTVEKALQIANQVSDKHYMAILKAWLAYILFFQGNITRSKQLFEEANGIYEILWPRVGELYGIFWEGYARFLITTGRLDDAYTANLKNLKWFTDNNLPAHISRCHRSLGVLKRIEKNYGECEKHLNAGLEIIRNIRIPFLEIDTLIELGRLRLETNDCRSAESDLKETLKLVDRTGFRLYEPVAKVVLAKVYLASGNLSKTREFAESAYIDAKQMNYYWAQKEAEELLKIK